MSGHGIGMSREEWVDDEFWARQVCYILQIEECTTLYLGLQKVFFY
jgi:hypothetical protein